MLRWAVCLFLAWGSSACTHLGGPVELGQGLAFELRDIHGQTMHLRAYRGRLVLIDFWAPWCTPCAEELPRLADLYTRLQAEGLEVVGVATHSARSDVEAFVEERALPFPTLLDEEGGLMRRLGLEEIPSWVLVDAHGRVIHVHRASPDDAFWQLEWVVRRGLRQLHAEPVTSEAAHGSPVRPAKYSVASRRVSL